MVDIKSIFDEVVPRRATGSYKWDSTDDSDCIPLWVADMDFRTAPVIIEALRHRVEHGIFGYTLVQDDYYDALINWFERKHNYKIKRENVIYTSGVVPAISAIIKALVAPGEGVIVQTPVYNCFFSSIRNNGCRIVENPLIREELSASGFTYRIDFENLECMASKDDVKLMLLCNPHNPAGRVWNRDDLLKVAEICHRHGVRVVSDEIHCELTMPGYEYVPYGTVDLSAIVCVSPSKAFNTAGLQIANIICPDTDVREKVDKAININEVCDVNPFGVTALKAAYSEEGDEWLSELREYLFSNYIYLSDRLATELPQCKITRLEATYLPWIDVSSFGIPSEELEELMKDEAHVWVNSGEMYGAEGFIRLNIACPRSLLTEGLNRIIGFLKNRVIKN